MGLKKIYFASDFHLGLDGQISSSEREKIVVAWIESIMPDAEALFLVGDIFDHWFEYKRAVPKGFTRLLGKLAQMSDAGIPIHYFTGNHDMWMFNYLTEEMGIPIYHSPEVFTIKGKKFFIGHGDGLGPGDTKYKITKKVFSNPLCQWAYGKIHPNIGIKLMKYFSGKSRDKANDAKEFLGHEREWLVQYCERKIKTMDVDYFVFGHRHLPIDFTLSDGRTRYINLGDWIAHFTYLEFDGNTAALKTFVF